MMRRVVDLAVVLVGLVVALWLAEFIAQKYLDSQRLVDDMDPGLVAYNRKLGWRLTPGWEGEHRNSDFTVRYKIDARGFRAPVSARTSDPAGAAGSSAVRSVTAVVGDSFTFGLGVPIEQTFVALLDERSRPSRRYRNLGVPGYSTDQQLLMLETDILRQDVKDVLPVIYMGNDLLDNAREHPLQAPFSKPLFGLDGTTLRLHNTPVPKRQQRPELVGNTMPAYALDLRSSWTRVQRRSALARLLGAVLPGMQREDVFARMETRRAAEGELFSALLGQYSRISRAHGAGLRLVLLPGRKAMVSPRSESAHVQAYFADVAAQAASRAGVSAINLFERLPEQGVNPDLWYFPRDGHLTRAGHQRVAAVLTAAISER